MIFEVLYKSYFQGQKSHKINYVSGNLLHGRPLTTMLFSSNNLQFTMAHTSEGSTSGTNTVWVGI